MFRGYLDPNVSSPKAEPAPPLPRDNRHPCDHYKGWKRVAKAWDNFLLSNNMALCRKNYGADGNCLYNAISGILKDYNLTRSRLGMALSDLPASVTLSLQDLNFAEDHYSVGDLRRLTAVLFIGVDPHNANALPFWEAEPFITKLEVLSQVEGMRDYGDIRWGPKAFLKELQAGGDRVGVARRVYAKLVQVKNPSTWGSYEDIDALAHVLNLDIYLFWSDGVKLQLFRGPRPPSQQRPALMLYYTVMQHFDAAGLVRNTSQPPPRPIYSMLRISDFPGMLRAMAT
ncbi:uncharacterized protein BcabD6B2_03460 [Babesia caballi]|uniref:Transmembrane protein, putative n=1 Tax=Babesia caballi TaxID=5871 RepID=A0AAV4LP87_BABCB|nr:transmembrane protein, putative [Babesia caballi]